jgi:hypothetical protein
LFQILSFLFITSLAFEILFRLLLANKQSVTELLKSVFSFNVEVSVNEKLTFLTLALSVFVGDNAATHGLDIPQSRQQQKTTNSLKGEMDFSLSRSFNC